MQTGPSLRALRPLYGVVVVAFLGYSMMVTLFVPLLMHRSSHFLPETFTTSQRTVLLGILLALYPLGQCFGCPIIGALSDRFGRKPVLLVSLLITTACYFFIGCALQVRSTGLLAASCLLCGLSESNIAVTQSAIADVTGPEDRGRLFGYIYTATSVSYVVGPIVAGALAERFGYALPFWIVLGLLLLTLIWTRAHFQETHRPQAGPVLHCLGALGNLGTLFTDGGVRRLYLVNFLFYVAVFGFMRVILMYMVDEWHMGVGKMTANYACLAFLSIIASFGLMPVLSRHVRLKHLAMSTAVLGGLGMVVTVIPRSAESILWTAGPTTMLVTLTLSACAALLSNSVASERQGRVMGNNQALQVAGEAAGVFVAGLVAAVLVKLPLIAFGVLLILAAVILLPFRPAKASERA